LWQNHQEFQKEYGMPIRNLGRLLLTAGIFLLGHLNLLQAQPLEAPPLPPLNQPLPIPGQTEPFVDRDVKPVQRLENPVAPTAPDSPERTPPGTSVPTGVTSSPGRGTAPVADPPPPVIQMQVRTPSHMPVGLPVPYKIVATNTSQSKALRVKVRLTASEKDGVAAIKKCEPQADGKAAAIPEGGIKPEELSWSFPKLSPGESKTIDVEFIPTAGKQVSATAYVSFEYGVKVETVVDKPKVVVKKTATPQVAAGELITVQVQVTNTSAVPAPNAVLTESVPADAEIRGDTEAEKTNNAGQRAWKLGTIAAGQTKLVTYQILSRKGQDVDTKSFVKCDGGSTGLTEADTKTKVVVPALKLEFTGPPRAEPRGTATYTAVVRNIGTMPLSNVKLAVDVPNDLRVTKVTNNCRTDKNPRVWIIPNLPAGESQEFKLSVEPEQGVAGRQVVKATARDGSGRLNEQSGEVTTDFIGRALLTWKPTFDSARVSIGRQSTLTVVVRNQGSETEKGAKLRITLPPEVKFVECGPVQPNVAGNTLTFPPLAIAPGKSLEYTLTYEGKTAGAAQFRLMLEAESLEKVLLKDQQIEIER
jgi:uncharacterized repeat protein (TIGR01451 family)